MNKTQSQRDIAKIKIAISQLGISDEDGDVESGVLSTYRQMLQQLTGKTSVSAKAMTDKERGKVISHLRRQGFRASARHKNRTRPKFPGMASNGQIGLLRHLWKCLIEAKALNAGESASLDSWIRNKTKKYNDGAGYSSVEFLPMEVARQMIEELKSWCHRLGIDWS
ncbi:MAG: GemA protein [Pseudohongiella sp.]|nr:MAG: GemA protein [Pseudohongiella sp.]